jgi:hypothetical protein
MGNRLYVSGGMRAAARRLDHGEMVSRASSGKFLYTHWDEICEILHESIPETIVTYEAARIAGVPHPPSFARTKDSPRLSNANRRFERLWHRLLGRPVAPGAAVAAAPGTAGVRVWAIMSRGRGHEGGERCRRVLVLAILRSRGTWGRLHEVTRSRVNPRRRRLPGAASRSALKSMDRAPGAPRFWRHGCRHRAEAARCNHSGRGR